MTARIEVENLIVEYDAPQGDGGVLRAVGPISFSIEAGQFVSLVGPSGCGKSTLIRVAAGLLAPTNGRVLLDGATITEPSPRIALMFQNANLMPWRTVYDNIALPLELSGVPVRERARVVFGLLPTLGLADFASAYPGELSGGMAQRVALGRVLIQRPNVLLLDEPFGALDAMTREQVSADLISICQIEQQTVLMVTHDINEAVLMSDRVLVMSRRPGRLSADIKVSMPRPRDFSESYSTAFGEIAQQIRSVINA